MYDSLPGTGEVAMRRLTVTLYPFALLAVAIPILLAVYGHVSWWIVLCLLLVLLAQTKISFEVNV